ncbi:translation initiation factor IF-3 [Candidatus Jorgensenbacteria bacterium GWA1_54_12]|uniref:Translation initiation factor IF-3 n=1 Tax=Candidatus Jorgensenbacteria bacterium GWA1_54_12 TaxID=1798468 RepID=A0A1F6BLH8_9BACT|nr:MAG: translation initiation factor IF-3 [Candidatus Jorgensenbacteria bacterium GWA1_54_12]
MLTSGNNHEVNTSGARRINKNIKAAEVRVVDDEEKNLGIMPLAEALKLAEERGLDLVEIAPQAQPPVVRICSFDKLRYREEKEARKKRGQQKVKDMKHVRITPRAAKNDLEVKARKAREFLEAGHRLEVGIFLRGREKANQDFAKQKLAAFIAMLGEDCVMAVPPRYSGRGFTTQILKK